MSEKIIIQVDTERLRIIPLTQEELRRLIDAYRDSAPELSGAYEEMLEHSIKDPAQSLWHTPWKLCLQSSGIEIGYAGFKGLTKGRTEIGYGINEEYREKGYATEAVKGLCDWAFQMEGVEAVEAETEPDNLASKRVLLKAGFAETGTVGEEGPRFIRFTTLLEEWREIMKKELAEAHTFEIHCWKEEVEAIEIALQYGKEKEFDWDYGTVVAGEVTGAFTEMLLQQPKPADTECFRMLTPFFSIFLDHGFSSEHYGTELHRPEPLKRTIRDNIIGLPYSLHDMRVTELVAEENQLTMKFAEGFEKNHDPCVRVDGEIKFYHVDWDFSFAYVLDLWANEGKFKGKKMFLADFVKANPNLNFEIVDETYGYNKSKFAGYLTAGRKMKECIIELYHFGDMEYLTEE